MATVTVGDAATHNEKEVKTKYPVEEGTTAGTTKQTGDKYLHPQGSLGVKSTVYSKDKVGLGD